MEWPALVWEYWSIHPAMDAHTAICCLASTSPPFSTAFGSHSTMVRIRDSLMMSVAVSAAVEV